MTALATRDDGTWKRRCGDSTTRAQGSDRRHAHPQRAAELAHSHGPAPCSQRGRARGRSERVHQSLHWESCKMRVHGRCQPLIDAHREWLSHSALVAQSIRPSKSPASEPLAESTSGRDGLMKEVGGLQARRPHEWLYRIGAISVVVSRPRQDVPRTSRSGVVGLVDLPIEAGDPGGHQDRLPGLARHRDLGHAAKPAIGPHPGREFQAIRARHRDVTQDRIRVPAGLDPNGSGRARG